MKAVKLYDMKSGMNPRRVRIFLAEKGISLPTVEVDMAAGENATPAYRAKNPMGKMPMLEFDDGSYLSESIAICRFFEAVQPQPPLFGATPLEQAQIEMWNRRMEFEIMRPIEQAFVNLSPFWIGKRHQVAAYGEHMQTIAGDRMAWLDRELATRPFVAGATYTVVDITAQAALLLGKNTGLPIPAELVHLQRWFKAVTSRPTARA
jgi:glutathione S-transferase